MDVKRFSCHPAVCLPFVLSSVPASEEICSVGDCGPAGSGSGGADYRSDLCHSHRQCACCWILPRHHREWLESPHVIDLLKHYLTVARRVVCFFLLNPNVYFICVSSWVLEHFWVSLASTWWKIEDPWWVSHSSNHIIMMISSPNLDPSLYNICTSDFVLF